MILWGYFSVFVFVDEIMHSFTVLYTNIDNSHNWRFEIPLSEYRISPEHQLSLNKRRFYNLIELENFCKVVLVNITRSQCGTLKSYQNELQQSISWRVWTIFKTEFCFLFELQRTDVSQNKEKCLKDSPWSHFSPPHKNLTSKMRCKHFWKPMCSCKTVNKLILHVLKQWHNVSIGAAKYLEHWMLDVPAVSMSATKNNPLGSKDLMRLISNMLTWQISLQCVVLQRCWWSRVAELSEESAKDLTSCEINWAATTRHVVIIILG